jgi:hypothetical protein
MSPGVRRILSSVLLVLASILAVIAILGAWADRQLLNTDQWVDTSSALLQDPAIQNATAAYLSDQLVAGPTLRAKIEQGLPPRLSALAAPLAAGAGELADRAAKRLIASGAFQRLWQSTNRSAHEQLVRVVTGDDTPLARAGIVVDLRPELGVLAERIGVAPGATGDQGTVRVLRGDNLETVRKIVHAVQTLRWVSVVLVLVLLVGGVALAPNRAHGIVGAGLALLVAGLLVLVVHRAGGNYIVDRLTATGADPEAARATWSVATSLLRDIAGALVVLGIVDLLAGWLAGGSGWARAVRRFSAPALTDHAGLVYGGVAVALLTLLAAGLLPAASQLWAIVLYALLAGLGVWALRRQVEREAAAGVP